MQYFPKVEGDSTEINSAFEKLLEALETIEADDHLPYSALFRHEKDLICALVTPDEYCTVQEAQDRINLSHNQKNGATHF